MTPKCHSLHKTSRWLLLPNSTGCWDSLLVERRTRNGKVASSNLSRSGEWIFFSRVNFVCWLLFFVHSTPVSPQWHVKYPGHSAKSAGSRLHWNKHTPLPNEVGVGWLCRCPGILRELIRKRAHRQLLRKHSVTVVSARWDIVDRSWGKSGISARELISTKKETKKKKKKRRRKRR